MPTNIKHNIPVKPRERNSKAVSFSNTVNPLLFKKMCFYVLLLKRICFLFNQMIFSGLILRLLFCHVNLLFVPHPPHRTSSHVCSSPVPLIAVRNCKNIRNCSVRCNSVSSSSSNVHRVSKHAYTVVSLSDCQFILFWTDNELTF